MSYKNRIAAKQTLNEISAKLKNTIKKYNEISLENDLFLQNSEDPYSNIAQQDKSAYSNIVYPSNDEAFDLQSNYYNADRLANTQPINNSNITGEYGIPPQLNRTYTPNYPQDLENQSNINNNQNNFISQINVIMNELNSFEDNVNKDFQELEKFVEETIEQELEKAYK